LLFTLSPKSCLHVVSRAGAYTTIKTEKETEKEKEKEKKKNYQAKYNENNLCAFSALFFLEFLKFSRENARTQLKA
jgi:hypothetical protein